MTWDIRLFHAINGCHSVFSDTLMCWISNRWIWIPMYVFFLWLLIKYFKRDTVILILLVALMILVSDQLSVLIKETVMRLRPCHDPSAVPVHMVDGKCGGPFGFLSSHASNTAALTLFLIMNLRKKTKYIYFFALWPLMISYSRVALGVHYPLDVLAGMAMGSLLGVLFYLAGRFARRKIPMYREEE